MKNERSLTRESDPSNKAVSQHHTLWLSRFLSNMSLSVVQFSFLSETLLEEDKPAAEEETNEEQGEGSVSGKKCCQVLDECRQHPQVVLCMCWQKSGDDIFMSSLTISQRQICYLSHASLWYVTVCSYLTSSNLYVFYVLLLSPSVLVTSDTVTGWD